MSAFRPLNMDTQQIIWSNYKQNSTLKYLVSVNPHGAVVFVSKACGGRFSDEELTFASGSSSCFSTLYLLNYLAS